MNGDPTIMFTQPSVPRRAGRAAQRWCLLTTLCIALLNSAAASGQSATAANVVELAGFQIDTSRGSTKEVKETLATLRRQIDIVESAALPSDLLTFFRSVPISIDPSLTGMNGEYSQVDGAWRIRARAGRWPDDRAILLHELLHAYHHQVLKQPTPPIGRAFNEARRDHLYPANYRDAYFLTNPKEYFAVIAEIYLSGPTFRPPFKCGNVLKVQPQFIAYLRELFGERECK
jgi:hypothetical protein